MSRGEDDEFMAGDQLLSISALKPILGSSTTVFTVVASSEEIVLSNQATANLLGSESPEEPVGRKWFEFVAPQTLPESRHRFHNIDDGIVLALTAPPLDVLHPDRRVTSAIASSRACGPRVEVA